MNSNQNKKEQIVFGGGCFWCTEAVFKMLRGVISVVPGYAGGHSENPTYEQVCSGTTGHAESVQIEYDSTQVSLESLLTVFFGSHDPTTQNRQGNDIGTEYRSIIFYTTPEQKAVVEKFIANINVSSTEGKPIVTEVVPLGKPGEINVGSVTGIVGGFFPAEDYHKDYFAQNPGNPYCEIVINPKLEKVVKEFGDLLQKNTHHNQ
jgi:peptide-methionine (S)-S-oxide reductase